MSYYTNLTKNDLLISDIGITIRAGQTVNPYLINPMLTEDQLLESEAIGALRKAFLSKKIAKSATLPKNEDFEFSSKIKECLKPIPSRARVGIVIDPKKKQYIEELTGIMDEQTLAKFQDYSDGFAEPDIGEETAGEDDKNTPITSATTPDSRYIDISPKPRGY